MRITHSPWPLFGDDLELARGWLRSQWKQRYLKSQYLHWALNLGMRYEVEELLHLHSKSIPESDQQGLKYRLALQNNHENPLSFWFSEDELNQGLERIRKPSNKSINIRLYGGIGDHLEQLALINHWCNNHQISVTLEIKAIRMPQLKRLLENKELMQFQLATNSHWEHPLNAMRFKAICLHGGESIRYSAWLRPIHKDPTGKALICCWRSKGIDDRLSCFNRSVAFNNVLDFYRSIIAKQNPADIIDLTNWQPWECNIIKKIGIQTHDPASADVYDLIKQTEGNQIITIDTALAHLCASIGQPAWLLLPMFADDRWLELLQPQNSYGQVLTVIQQREFNCWKEPLEKLQQHLEFQD